MQGKRSTPEKDSSQKLEQEVPMLSKCVNPACFANFRYLHEGKVFRLERGGPRIEDSAAVSRSFEYFWLCGTCASFLTVVFEGKTVTVRPLHLELPASSLPLPVVATGKVA
jgi:hypothetical protein